MVLLVEQVRSVADEEALVNDTASYQSVSATVHEWQTRVSKGFTLTKEKLIYIQWDTYAYNCYGNGRVVSGSTPIASTGAVTLGATTTRKVWVLLAAGSYTLDFQTAADSGGTGFYMRISNIKIAAFVFSDMDNAAYDSGQITCSNNATTTVLNQNITIPASRVLPVGNIKNYAIYILVYMLNTTSRLDYPKNSGESNAASALSWKIFWDSFQDSWTDRKEDVLSVTVNPSYGVGAFGTSVKDVAASSTKNLQIKVYNNSGSTKYCRCYVQVFICPWVITDNASHEPASLDFPQGSTFYVVLEPLSENLTKDSKIGKARGISFGDSTDFYSISSGMDILTHSYQFELVKVGNANWFVDGLNACISIIGVDAV